MCYARIPKTARTPVGAGVRAKMDPQGPLPLRVNMVPQGLGKVKFIQHIANSASPSVVSSSTHPPHVTPYS
jgi:hypothetical protein